LTPQLVKPAVAKYLNALMAPIIQDFEASKEWQELTLKAYPPPVKKEKKVKNRGTRFPGGNVEKPKADGAQPDGVQTELPERPAN
jgi:tyrosyl-tRNA synthetase